jgi:death-on-curing family protein
VAAFYEQADLVTQAAILIAAIALSHPFLDGNKRTAVIAAATFLDLNGLVIDCRPPMIVWAARSRRSSPPTKAPTRPRGAFATGSARG